MCIRDRYYSISGAISAASNDDVVRVWEGTYYEMIAVDKRITLIGNGTSKTFINGSAMWATNVIVRLASDGAVIQNLSIISGPFLNGIIIAADDCEINNIRISHAGNIGLSMGDYKFATISDTIFYKNENYGIYLYSSASEISVVNNLSLIHI